MKGALWSILFSLIKLTVHTFYRVEVRYLTPKNSIPWTKIRMMIFLNHTSLYEPLFIGAAPHRFLWHLAFDMIAPGADKTLNRPIVGLFWKILFPHVVSITRKKDESWDRFLNRIGPKSVIAIAPEGRMLRADGLDSQGKAMSVRGGVAELLEMTHEGYVLMAYSGGLHHVQRPGEGLPKLFKTIRMNLECLDIVEYKKSLSESEGKWKLKVVRDLEQRIQKNCPRTEDSCPAWRKNPEA